MTYTKTDWKDHVVDNNTGAVIQQGTPVSAKNLNNIEQGVASLFDQLEASKVQQANLPPGVSVINTDVGGPVETLLRGETRVNILGDIGNFEKDTNNDGIADGFNKINTENVLSVSSSIGVVYGAKAQKIEAKATDTVVSRGVITGAITLLAGKYYVAVANEVIEGTGVAALRLYNRAEDKFLALSTSIKDGAIFCKFAPTSDYFNVNVAMYNVEPLGGTGAVYFDGVGLYEIDKAIYDRIGVDINESNIRDFFPHVDGKQHVNGIAIEKKSKNLVPNFYENGLSYGPIALTINDPYEIAVTNTIATVTLCYFSLDVVPNTNYAINFDLCEGIFGVYPDASNVPSLLGYRSTAGEFNSGPNKKIRVYMRIENVGTFRFKNPMVVAGRLADLPTTFEPNNPQRMILPVTLAEAGGIRDEVTVRGAEAQLTRRIERNLTLDAAKVQAVTVSPGRVGYKAIPYNLPAKGIQGAFARLIRYDGFKFAEVFDTSKSGNVYLTASGDVLGFTVSNLDSGWVDNVDPNLSATKALLNGWKADANDGSKYTSWVSLLDGKAPATNTEAYVAANKAPGWTAYAVADYVLAKPEQKPNSGEGAISLHKGNNQIMIETGMVYREKVSFNTTTKQGTTSQRCRKVIGVYKGYDAEPFTTYTSAGQAIPQLVNDVDTNVDYFVTYVVVDKFSYTANVTDVSCTYGANTKSVLDRTVRNIAELDTKAMVLTRSVAELYKKVKALGG